jgi:hypothetical protein
VLQGLQSPRPARSKTFPAYVACDKVISPLPLLHLDPQVITQEAEVAHLEHLLHLGLELDDLASFAPCDDKIIDIDADKQIRVSVATAVDTVFE